MLANRAIFPRGFADVDEHVRRQACHRNGVAKVEYEIRWREHTDSGVWLWDQLCAAVGSDATEFSVRFTAEELRSLDRAVLPKLQEVATLSGRTCQVLVSHAYNVWDTDSSDHISMRRAGLYAYLLHAQSVRCDENWCFGVCCGMSKKGLPTLSPIRVQRKPPVSASDPPEGGEPETTFADIAGFLNGIAGGTDDDVPGPEGRVTSGDAIDTILPGNNPGRDPNQEMGLSRGDPTNRQLAGDSGNSRVWLNDGIIGIRGQSFVREDDEFTQCATDQINGVVVGPLRVDPNVFSLTQECVEYAFKKRVEEKQRVPGQNGAPCVSPHIKASIATIVKTAMSDSRHHKQWAPFSTDNIKAWIADNQWYTDIKSKKWSESRMEQGLNKLYSDANVEFRLKGSIKFEQMREGQAPRILVADGDEGQIMALLCIKCNEDLLFKHMEARSTKHTTRDGARARACKMHRRDDKFLSVIEGDGSAWDFTNTHPMRDMVENPILRKIMAVLIDAGLCPSTWHEAYIKVIGKKKIKVFIELKCEDVKFVITIEACRRSGERGTSALNWWMNFTVWIAVVFPPANAYKFLSVEQKWGIDRQGVNRYFCLSLEGDDSLISTSPHVNAKSAFGLDAEAAWHNCGFNMKIIYATTRATFTGSWYLVDKHGLTGEAIAEIPRLLNNWPICTSAGGKAAARNGDHAAVSGLCKAACISRADELATSLPSIAEKFLEFMPRVEVGYDHDLSMRSQGEEGHMPSEIEHLIELKLSGKRHDELSLLNRFGLKTTASEWKEFLEEPWQHDAEYWLGHIGKYRSSIPSSW
jgi:hypothetical protein